MTTTTKNKMINNHESTKVSRTRRSNYNLDKSRLGVIGGSGLYRMERIEKIKELTISTPYGKPSEKLILGKLGGMEIVFLARHGIDHTFNPSEIPYRANIWALRSLGVRWILSASAVGSLQEKIKPLDIVIPNQFIDRTHQRPLTFFSNGAVAHISMADPFCKKLSEIVAEESKKVLTPEKDLHIGGTYLAMEGPAFSTRAESNLFRSWNCSVIGMTNHTEARLAKEAEIAYTSLSMVTDYDCWHDNYQDVSVEIVIENLLENAKVASQIIESTAKRICSKKPSSDSHSALKNALVTRKDAVPKITREKIELFTNDYW